jgi:hypothetical protein
LRKSNQGRRGSLEEMVRLLLLGLHRGDLGMVAGVHAVEGVLVLHRLRGQPLFEALR